MRYIVLFGLLAGILGCGGNEPPTPKTDLESLKRIEDETKAARDHERGGKGQTKGKLVKNKNGIPDPE